MPTTPDIPLASPDIGEHEEQAVLDVLRSGRLSLGPALPEFERLLADYAEMPWGCGVSSGTGGLHLVVRSLGIGEGDCVVMSSFSFIASANAVRYEGAQPVFVDIDPDTLCLSPAGVADYLGSCVERDGGRFDPDTGLRVAAILTTDIFGHPADPGFADLAEAHDIALISDSCEALGSRYRRPDGSQAHAGSDASAAVFAFYPNKQITTGEGGMIVGRDPALRDRVVSLRNQGRAPDDPWLRHSELGYNYRMDELSAALGCAQMRRVDDLLARRARVVSWYADRLASIDGVSGPAAAEWAHPAWFVEFLRTDPGTDRDRCVQELNARGVASKAYFDAPIHLQPPYAGVAGLVPGSLPNTDAAAEGILIVPMFAAMTEQQVDRVCAALADAVGRAA